MEPADGQRFSASSGDFALKLASPPAATCKEASSLPATSPRHGTLTLPVAGRRHSLLSSMLCHESASLDESAVPIAEVDEEQDAMELGSPFLGSHPSEPTRPSSASSTSKSHRWPRSASLSHTPSESPDIAQPQHDPSFNPLNPMAESKPRASTSHTEAHRTVKRSQSSPSLKPVQSFPLDMPTTPPAQRNAPSSFDDASTSFKGLGVVLPSFTANKDQSTDGHTSPIPIGPQRRAVQRRGSLYPKPKGYLRVQAQLSDESKGPDVEEMLSEATLYRLHASRSSVSSPGGLRSSVFGRFPEAALTDDDDYFGHATAKQAAELDTSDEGEMDAGDLLEGEPGSLGDGVSAMDVEHWRRQQKVWLGFREKQSPGGAGALSRSLGNTSNNGMELDLPAGRPNKRKWNESDRFESYNSLSFKRRAVSPTASLSSALGSPILTSSMSAPINIPGSSSQGFIPGLGYSPSSRGGSPAPRDRPFYLGHLSSSFHLPSIEAEADDEVSRAGGMIEEIEM